MLEEDGFTTERLCAGWWRAAASGGTVEDLPATVASMLTEPVTRWLPSEWKGPYTRERAQGWIAEQDAEGRVLLVRLRSTHEPLGLILLFEEPTEDGVDLRLGYLLAEHAWGQGYGEELLGGFIEWCRKRGDVRAIIGGVAPENAASVRLLERHGFSQQPAPGHSGDLVYRLSLMP